MKQLIGKNVVITKITDDRFEGNHPNGINKGYSFEGEVVDVDPILYIENGPNYFHTSLIGSFKKESDTQYTVKTLNSTYSVEVKE